MSIPPHRDIQKTDRMLSSPREDSAINEARDPNAVEKSSGSGKILGNILSLGSGVVIARVMAFIGTTYVARKLGPEQFGIIGFAAALFGYLALAVTAGFNDIGSREVARRPREASSIAASVIIIRLALAFIALIIIGAAAWSLNKPPTLKLVLVLMGLSFFSLALDVSWVYNGLEQNWRVSGALILSQALYVLTVLIAVNGPEDVIFVPFGLFLGELVAAVALGLPLFRSRGKVSLDLREGLHMLRSSSFMAVTRLMRTLMYTFDVVLIGFLLGEREVGLYTAPYRVCFLLVALAVAIQSSYLPAITRAFAENAQQVSYIAERSVTLATAVAAPMIVGGMVLSASLLQTVFGHQYIEGSEAFRLLILSTGFVFIHGAIHNILLAYDRLKIEMLIVAIAAVINVKFHGRYAVDENAYVHLRCGADWVPARGERGRALYRTISRLFSACRSCRCHTVFLSPGDHSCVCRECSTSQLHCRTLCDSRHCCCRADDCRRNGPIRFVASNSVWASVHRRV